MTTFLNQIQQAYPKSNCEILKHYLDRYKHVDAIQFIQSLAADNFISSYQYWNDTEFQLTQLDLARLTARSMCCKFGNRFDCIGIYDKLIDIKRPSDMDEITWYKQLIASNAIDPDDHFNISIEKLKLLFNYFERIASIGKEGLNNIIVVTRISNTLSDLNIFSRSPPMPILDGPLVEINLINGYMHLDDPIKVDFAAKNIGGGVLTHGCCQEEIMFLSNPELIGLMSLIYTLNSNESVIVSGITQYSKVKYYGFDMCYDGQYDSGISQSIIMMDAIDYREQQSDQFKIYSKLQELYKAVNGFSGVGSGQYISTGHWGCGAFKGDSILKFMIQWLAASATGNRLTYYLGNNYSDQYVRAIHKQFKDFSTSDLYAKMLEYGE